MRGDRRDPRPDERERLLTARLKQLGAALHELAVELARERRRNRELERELRRLRYS